MNKRGRPAKPREPCIIGDCGRIRFGHGYCSKHYKRWRTYGDPLFIPRREPGATPVCEVPECKKEHVALGLCSAHYARFKSTGRRPSTPLRAIVFRNIKGPCSRPECYGESRGSGLCDRHRQRGSHIRSKYGLSYDQLDAIFNQQLGLCGICLDQIDLEDRHCNIDHDHGTGEVRGLLCGTCNRGLGLFKDKPENLRRAVDYLGDKKAKSGSS